MADVEGDETIVVEDVQGRTDVAPRALHPDPLMAVRKENAREVVIDEMGRDGELLHDLHGVRGHQTLFRALLSAHHANLGANSDRETKGGAKGGRENGGAIHETTVAESARSDFRDFCHAQTEQ